MELERDRAALSSVTTVLGDLTERVTAMAQELRSEDLYKVPGVSETIDWVSALVALDRDTLIARAKVS